MCGVILRKSPELPCGEPACPELVEWAELAEGARWTGFEPAVSSVTGRRFRPLSYHRKYFNYQPNLSCDTVFPMSIGTL